MQACVQPRRQRRDAMLSPALMDITAAATMVGIPAASPTMANTIIAATGRFPGTADPFPMVVAPASGECSDEPSVARTDLRGRCDELTCWNPAYGSWMGSVDHRALLAQTPAPLSASPCCALTRRLQQGFQESSDGEASAAIRPMSRLPRLP